MSNLPSAGIDSSTRWTGIILAIPAIAAGTTATVTAATAGMQVGDIVDYGRAAGSAAIPAGVLKGDVYCSTAGTMSVIYGVPATLTGSTATNITVNVLAIR